MDTLVDLNALYHLDAFERLARQRLSAHAHTFINGGAGSSKAVGANCRAWGQWALRSRVLRNVAERHCTQTVLGQPVSIPILIAPSGLHGLVHADGEVATARAAHKADTIMVLSMHASLPVEAVANTGAQLWFQLYWGKDRGIVQSVIERAIAAGCRALCLTLDMPVRPWLHGPMRAAVAAFGDIVPAHGFARRAHLDAQLQWDHDATLTWQDLDWLRRASPVPIILKGILTAEDAQCAADHGADAIIVSNHGGRVLEEGLATADVLPEIVEAVQGRLEVLVDGGVRSGADVFKALALGARAVLLGRPALWGLAVGGEAGVGRVLDILRGELESIMGMTGTARVADIQHHLITRRIT